MDRDEFVDWLDSLPKPEFDPQLEARLILGDLSILEKQLIKLSEAPGLIKLGVPNLQHTIFSAASELRKARELIGGKFG